MPTVFGLMWLGVVTLVARRGRSHRRFRSGNAAADCSYAVALLSGAGVLPVESGNAVFYTNQTSNDQVADFMQGMRHEMGRGMVRDALVESFEAVRARLGGG